MIDPFVLLAPALLLAVVGLLRFVGCVGDNPQTPAPTQTPPPPDKTEKPIFKPDLEVHNANVSVFITSPGARVYYNVNSNLPPTDQSTPLDPSSPPVEITETTTFRAIAIAPGKLPSDETSKKYTIAMPPPPPVPPAWVGLAGQQSTVVAAAEPTDRLSTTPYNGVIGVGNLIVVWVWYIPPGNEQVDTMSDLAGNVYTRLVGPTQSGAEGRPEIWYTTVTYMGNPFQITAEFQVDIAGPMEIVASQYAGPKKWAPGQPPKENSGSFPANPVTSGPVALVKSELAFATALVEDQATADPATPFTTRSTTPLGNVVMDYVAQGVENVEAKFQPTNQQQLWVTQLVTFKEAP